MGEATTFFTLTVVNFGTNLLHYATYDGSFSHVYSFALFAIFIYLTEQFFQNKKWRTSIILGITLGLALMVRQTNIFLILFLLSYIDNLNPKKIWLRYRPLLLKCIIIGLFAFLFFLPQMLYWKYVGGSFLLFSYPGEYFDFAKPEILNVLFSVRKGLFFWTPVLLFILPGFVIMFKKKDKLSFWALLFFIIQIYLISSWWAWFYGFAYGHRAFTETYTILAIPLAYFFRYIPKIKSKVIKILTIGLILFFFIPIALSDVSILERNYSW